MKRLARILIGLLITSTVGAYAQSVGACYDNVAQSIANGVLVPLPSSQIYFCTNGTSLAACQASPITLFNNPALTGLPIQNPVTADAGGNFIACAAPGQYGVAVVASVGFYIIPSVSFVTDWTHGGTINGALTATLFVGPLSGNATTASALAATPIQCSAGQYFAGIAANGNANGCTTLPAAATLFYQTVQGNGSSLTQRAFLNFDSNFVASDTSPSSTVHLAANISVNAATATHATAAAAFDHTPTQCGTGTVATGINSAGAANCTAISVLARSCGANGCSILYSDGTKHEWGTVSVPGSGTSTNTATITFPLAFTTTANLSVRLTTYGVAPSGGSDVADPPVAQLSAPPSVSSASVFMAQFIRASEGGGDFDNTITLAWDADGN